MPLPLAAFPAALKRTDPTGCAGATQLKLHDFGPAPVCAPPKLWWMYWMPDSLSTSVRCSVGRYEVAGLGAAGDLADRALEAPAALTVRLIVIVIV